MALMEAGSPFAPLRHVQYRRLWLAMLCLNFGLWMLIVSAGWVMVSMTDSALLVGMIQTAATLPSFLFALPGGVIADLVERRTYLLRAQAVIAVVGVLTTLLTWSGQLSPWALLGLTFVYGVAHAIQGPAWFTSQTDVLPEEDRLAGMTLAGASYSTARAVGPAIAGALIALASAAAAFAVTAVMAVLSIILLRHVAPLPRHQHDRGREGFVAAMLVALRHAASNRMLQIQLLRTGAFVTAGAGLWALLPLAAKRYFEGGASSYGLLMGFIGIGSVLGGISLPLAASRIPARTLDTLGCLAFALATVAVAFVHVTWAVAPLFVLAGMGWAWVGNLNMTDIQSRAEPWIRARTLALYLIVFQGGMAAGGALWGAVGVALPLDEALLICAACQVLAAWFSRSLPIDGVSAPAPA
jgi:MFS family permease